jgi:hypothetical protein
MLLEGSYCMQRSLVRTERPRAEDQSAASCVELSWNLPPLLSKSRRGLSIDSTKYLDQWNKHSRSLCAVFILVLHSLTKSGILERIFPIRTSKNRNEAKQIAWH